MTNTPAAEALERWPGYNEQSWSERFAELDRRHSALFEQIATRAPRPTPPPALEREAVAKAMFSATGDRFIRWEQCLPAADAILSLLAPATSEGRG